VDGVKGLVALERKPAEPIETEQLVLVGYVTAPSASSGKPPLPPVRVELTRVRSLQRLDRRVNTLELDARLPPYHSGGPLLDEEGRLVGVVGYTAVGTGRGTTFAFSAARLAPVLGAARIIFAATGVPYDKRHEKRDLSVRVETLGKPQPGLQLEMELSTRPGERRVYKAEAVDDAYRFQVVPIPPQEDHRVTLEIRFEGSTVKLEVPDQEIKLDDKSYRLSQLDRVERRDGNLVVVRTDASTFNAAQAAGTIAVEVGGQPVSLDLGRALAITVSPPGPQAKEVHYRVVVRREGKVLAREEGVLPLEGIPPAVARAALELEPQPAAGVQPNIRDPKLNGKKRVIELGEPYSQVCTGGGGRHLIFHLPKARKLAVVDVSEGLIVGRIDLPADDVLFAAGSERLMLALPAQKLLQRYSLSTLKKDQTVALPGDETVFSIRMGSNARNPLFLFDGKEVFLWDVERMQQIETKGKHLTGRPGGNDFQFRVSAGGQSALGWEGGGSRYALQRLQGSRSTLVEGPGYGPWAQPSADGSLVLRINGGMSTWNLRPVLANAFKGHILLPCEDPRFFLAVQDKPGKTSTAELCTVADRRSVFSLTELEPVTGAMASPQRGHINGEPRVRYLPSSNLVVVLPDGNDRVVLRPFDLMAELAAGLQDYLFVTSVPPTRVRRGSAFSYSLEVRSRHAGLTYNLDVGPKGMTVSKEGVVRWEAPAQLGSGPIRVAITVRNDGGKETLHVFDLAPE
jgi:hypothetical protein